MAPLKRGPFGEAVGGLPRRRPAKAREGHKRARGLPAAACLIEVHVTKGAGPSRPRSDKPGREAARRGRADTPLPRARPLTETRKPTRRVIGPIKGELGLLLRKRGAAPVGAGVVTPPRSAVVEAAGDAASLVARCAPLSHALPLRPSLIRGPRGKCLETAALAAIALERARPPANNHAGAAPP